MPSKTKRTAAAEQTAQPQIPSELLDQLVSSPMTAGQVQALIDAAPGVSVLIDREGTILALNQAGTVRFAVERREALGSNLFSFFQPPLANSRRAKLERVLAERQAPIFEDCQHDQHFRNSAIPVIDHDGEIRRIAIFSEDVTDHDEAVAQLRESEAQYRFLAENTADVVWQLDDEMRFVYINGADQRLRGVPRDQVIGTSVLDVYPPEGKAILGAATKARQEQEACGEPVNPTLYFEVPQLRHDGSIVWVETVSTRIYDETGKLTGYIGITRDIEERRRYQAMLEDANKELQARLEEITGLHALLREKALRDGLTGLHNRHYLHETLPREFSRASREEYPLALIMIDLDHFKAVNDTYGHVAGDQVLKLIAEILREQAREGDLACRFGGEEFLIAMPHMSLADALIRTEVWRATIAQARFEYEGHHIPLTASLGIAVFPDHGHTDIALVAAADHALYAAKHGGRNRVSCYIPTEDD
jgi:diguanylate cyclase (GGDEF)-like protein/PAS domain S-box-containing protein